MNKTPVRLVLIHIVLITLSYVSSSAQTLSDSEFKVTKFVDCIPIETGEQIFAKVEVDPTLVQFNKQDFDKIFGRVLNEMNLAEETNGIIKIKILFAKDQNLCMTQIGTKSLLLSALQIDTIKSKIDAISEFSYGRQRNTKVNCLGILYIEIYNGMLINTRNINFSFGK